jgi:asparagine synthase (glutamine-hydrolysing)
VCGIALIVGRGGNDQAGQGADGGDGGGEALFATMLRELRPRGEVTEVAREPGVLAGVRRLRIVDRERAVQPWTTRRWLLCYNGEIFNYRQLRAELGRLGRTFRSESDTELVAEAFDEWGEEAVRRFRGEFAFAIVDRASGRTYLARDPVGVKPLYWSLRAGRLHVASEVKALVPARARVHEVPPGHHGWAGPKAGLESGSAVRLVAGPRAGQSGARAPELSAYADLSCLGEHAPPLDDPAEAAEVLRLAVEDSVRVRADTDLPVGVILSGGLDSSIVLSLVRQLHPDCVALTIGAPGSDDLVYARRLCAELGVRHEVISVRPGDIRAADMREAIRMSELTEYGDIINAVVSVPLFARARDLGIKVVLTGDGSDELFGGYPMYERNGADATRRLFLHMIRNLHRTELQRVDRISMGHSVEARVPYLDPVVLEVAMRLPVSLKIRDGQEKWVLRQAFAGLLPDYILSRPKNPMSHSSGLHERARLYRALFASMQRSFGYGLLGSVRRDFSVLLSQCGHDLDLAVAAAQVRRDYTAAEHARDLAGALRWNVTAGLRSRGVAGASSRGMAGVSSRSEAGVSSSSAAGISSRPSRRG